MRRPQCLLRDLLAVLGINAGSGMASLWRAATRTSFSLVSEGQKGRVRTTASTLLSRSADREEFLNFVQPQSVVNDRGPWLAVLWRQMV